MTTADTYQYEENPSMDAGEYTKFIVDSLAAGTRPVYVSANAGQFAPLIEILLDDYDPTKLDEFQFTLDALKNKYQDTFKKVLETSDEIPDEVPDKVLTPKELCSFSADDAGNGDAMFAAYGRRIVWCSSRGWLAYNGKYWQMDPDGSAVRRRAVASLRQRRHAAVDEQKEEIVKTTKADDKRINGSMNRFKSLVSVSIDTFDNDPDLLNCNNGVLNLRTGKVAPHNPKQRFTYCLPVDYKKSTCAEWLDFLQSVVGGGNDIINYLQMALGYSFTGHTREEIMFYLFGPTRSGKGTFSETIMKLMPQPLADGVDFNTFTAKREGDMSNFDLAPMKPSRIIFASESNKSQSLNPAKVKSLTGGDTIRACYKHKDFFSFRPQFKIWLMSNFSVNADPEDDALWGRVRVIEFPNSFLGKEDKAKKMRLKDTASLEGILYWIVQGAMKWYQLGDEGLPVPASIAKSNKAHRDDQDYIQKWLDDCSERVADGWTSNKDANTSYVKWCDENNVQHPKGAKSLTQSLKLKGIESDIKKVSGKATRGFKGIQIIEE